MAIIIFYVLPSPSFSKLSKYSLQADELAESAKSKVKDVVRVDYNKAEKGEAAATDAAKEASDDSNDGGKSAMLVQFAKELAFFSAVCLAVYLIGYLQVSPNSVSYM